MDTAFIGQSMSPSEALTNIQSPQFSAPSITSNDISGIELLTSDVAESSHVLDTALFEPSMSPVEALIAAIQSTDDVLPNLSQFGE